jgi:hypothetical protein
MSPHRWRRVQDLFADLADLPPEARAAALDREASGDPRLRAEVEALLAVERDAARFFAALEKALPPDRTRLR